MNRWAQIGHRFNLPPGLTDYGRRPAVKWGGLLVAWVIVTAILSAAHLGVLLLVIMAGLIGYVVYAILRVTPRAGQQASGLRPGRSRPSAPPGWEFWVWPNGGAKGRRMGRYRHTGGRHRDST